MNFFQSECQNVKLTLSAPKVLAAVSYQAVHKQNTAHIRAVFNRCAVFQTICSGLVELFLAAFAAWAFPVVGEVLKGNTVVFGRVIDISAHGADILA